MLRWMLLLALFVFAGSSPARAYPLNPYQVVWPFEAHGSAPGDESVYQFTGELKLSDPAVAPTLIFTVYAVGDVRPASGFVSGVIVNSPAGLGTDAAGGSQGGFYEYSPAVPLVNDLEIDLADSDGVAFDGGSVDPNGFFLPPAYAPDIDLFESHQFVASYRTCFEAHATTFCYDTVTFNLTIDRFVDPVPAPEPAAGALGLSALALLGAARRWPR